MNFTPENVELIVQRVLEHLETPGGAAPPATSSTIAPAVPTAAPTGVRIGEQVVTLALLADAAGASTQVRIGPRAILTPSARDFVRNRGIDIIRESPTPGTSPAARWQIIVTHSTPQTSAAVEGLAQNGIAFDQRLLGLPAEAAGQGVSALCRGEATKVVVLTSQPELVACLANRNDRIRAAAVGDAAAIGRVQNNLKPNLLSIDPTGKGAYELKSLLKALIP